MLENSVRLETQSYVPLQKPKQQQHSGLLYRKISTVR
nr:MAG TPA: hypothetical protein [Bacteriophage sp.]